MEKAYNHGHEDSLYSRWEASGAMRADASSTKPPFTIPLPPPNVTGQLHLGHAAMLAVEDILIRYKAMQGHEVLWVPGTDHAAIATENVVLKHLGAASREDFSREEFLQHCRDFAQKSHDTIINQTKKMGAWLDWSREAYTFDEERSTAVNTLFEKLYSDGLIERGYRMINWSVGAQSVLADDEVEWEDRDEPFYHIQCGPFVIGTVRPETKCADSALVVNPEDPRYKHLIGTEFEFETYAGMRKFHVIGDDHVDPELGTGAMTISPAHDANDYDIAKRHGLPFIEKINKEGKMTSVAGPCEGMTVLQARKEAVRLMKEKGILVEEKPYTHNVPLCYRTGTVVEPMLSHQWFIMVNKPFIDEHTGAETTLKEMTLSAVKEADVEIIPERFKKIYYQWIENLRDWCISRQIWWGHRIPIWYDADGNEHVLEQKKVYFARHGQSEGNLQNIIQGSEMDSPLTELGRQQAMELAIKAQSLGIKHVIASRLLRAKETATIIAQETGADLRVIEDLQEISCGELSGTPRVDNTVYGIQSACIKAKTGESWSDIKSRAKRALGALKLVPEKTLVIGHGAFTLAIKAVLQGVETEAQWLRFCTGKQLENCQVIALNIAMPEPDWKQDEDTLDTWFSSALWPFSTLGWNTENLADFEKFYPMNVLETGHDILFFWVARMIMFGKYATGKYPFSTVYLHGLVCDEKGKKMSKSKGNGIDPLDVIADFGADAVRLSLVIGTSPGNNIPLGSGKIKGYRNFVNKLWNATRFVQMQATGVTPDITPKSIADQWIYARFADTAKIVQERLDAFHISSAGDTIYHFVWDEFCDWYIESSKANPTPAFSMAIMLEILKLVHPLCPFVTEACWEALTGRQEMLLQKDFPVLTGEVNQDSITAFEVTRNAVGAIRKLRADEKLNPKEKLSVSYTMNADAELLSVLAQVTVHASAEAFHHAKSIVTSDGDIFVDIPFDPVAEKTKLEKQLSQTEKQISGFQGRLANEKYVASAPPNLVQQTRDNLEKALQLQHQLKAEINALG